MSTAQTSNAQSHSQAKTRPVHEVRFGRIRAAIWENRSEQGTRYNTTVSRIYKQGETWRETQSFQRDDLPLVAKVLDICHTWIYAQSPASDKTGSS